MTFYDKIEALDTAFGSITVRAQAFINKRNKSYSSIWEVVEDGDGHIISSGSSIEDAINNAYDWLKERWLTNDIKHKVIESNAKKSNL